jgi:hypothetical protein
MALDLKGIKKDVSSIQRNDTENDTLELEQVDQIVERTDSLIHRRTTKK